MSRAFLVISAVGPDRIGIVDDVSAFLTARHCNIEESKMAVLGGEFALIMLVSGEESRLGEVSSGAQKLGSDLGLRIETRQTHETKAVSGRPYLIESVSLDTQGILHSLTSVLRAQGVNIEDLQTETTLAPWTGSPMFVMKTRVTVPAGASVQKLRLALEDLAASQDLDIRMSPVPD